MTTLRVFLNRSIVLGPLLLGSAATAASAADDLQAGAAVYRAQCASCHGAKGEGVADEYARPLVGDQSIGELTEVIERTMPKDEPEKCVGVEARNVAAYVYETFYSPLAQARNRPPQVEPARLTVRQYRETLADLIAGLRETTDWGTERGLKGEYSPSRRFKKGGIPLTRVDPVVQFYFGNDRPYESRPPTRAATEPTSTKDKEADKEEKKRQDQADDRSFAARWIGSIFAPDSGDYEFNLQCVNGCQLFINDDEHPLIDAEVRSGDDPDHRETIALLGGRHYLIRVEFFKSKEAKENQASIVLRWKRPGGVEEVVPSHYLSTAWTPEIFLVRAPFPPDDRSFGYERGNDVTKAWDQATTDGAIETAAYVMAHLAEFSNIKNKNTDRAAKLQEFAAGFVERVFRRPLTSDQRELYVDRIFRETKEPEQAVARVVLLALKSPRFLFRELDVPPGDPYSIASKLSYALWDSLPDEELLKAAARGKLKTPDDVRRQAERMADDPRTAAKLRAFCLQWLKVDRFKELVKDAKQFADFDATVAADLRTSFDLSLEAVLNSPEADFRKLLTSDEIFFNGRLAKFYGVKLPADAPFQPVRFEADRRAGVVTHPLLMTGFAYTATSSPIHRGVLLSRSLLGRILLPPPEAVVPLPVELHPNLSNRERVTLQTKDQACASCHTMINNLGFALENFDAVGRYRKSDGKKPIDASGSYRTRGDATVRFTGGRELARFLADSPETHEAVVVQLFQYLVKQPILAYGLQQPAQLRQAFASHGFNLRKLAVEIAVTAATVENN